MITPSVFAQIDDWETYNSSLLIEVTRPFGVFTCSGVAVSRNIVITAAHCLEGSVKNVRVFTQAVYNPKLPNLKVKSFKLHPGYDPRASRYRSDLAKIVIKDPLPPRTNIWPIMEGTKLLGTIYRFGFGERNNKNVRTLITPFIRKLNPQESVLELNDYFSRSGDSGGPVFLINGPEISLLAIHSTFSFGPEGNYSLNPLLGPYTSWIFDN